MIVQNTVKIYFMVECAHFYKSALGCHGNCQASLQWVIIHCAKHSNRNLTLFYSPFPLVNFTANYYCLSTFLLELFSIGLKVRGFCGCVYLKIILP